MIIRTAPPEHFDWLAKRAQLVCSPAFQAVEAIDESGRIHGMLGCDGFMPNSATMSIALENPAVLRRLLYPAFYWLFEQTGRGIATCAVLSTNTRSLRLVQHVGFKEVSRGRNWWAPDVDIVFFEMKRAACRWIRPTQKASKRWAA